MGIKFVGTDIHFNRTIELQIRQLGQRAAKHAVEEMRDGADEIVKDAKRFAPHDEGFLEEAIQRNIDEERDPEFGGRRIVAVWVNPDMPGSGGKFNSEGQQVSGMKVGEYAMRLHEGQPPAPGGKIGIGKGTEAKGPQAGGKFLERAINLVKERMTDRIMGLMRRQRIL